MKKVFLTVVLLTIMLLGGCNKTEDPVQVPAEQPTQLPDAEQTQNLIQQPADGQAAPEIQETHGNRRNIPFEDDQLYAVAYLGYITIEDMDYYLENFLDEEETPLYYFSGDEFYLIIPRYEDMEVRLYRNDLATMEKALEQECEPGKPFIVQCNVSDIFPDVTVELTYNGETVEFSPYISLKDGSVQVGERGLNITRQTDLYDSDLQEPGQTEEIGELSDEGWVSMTDEEIKWFNEEFFNADEKVRKNNFVNCAYPDAESIDIYEIFYNFSERMTEEEWDALQGSEIDFGTDFQKLSTGYINDILCAYMNVSLEETHKNGLDSYLYLERFDAYFGTHGDTNYSPVRVTSGFKDDNGTVKLRYLRTEERKEYVVTLQPHENGYYFVSNVECK